MGALGQALGSRQRGAGRPRLVTMYSAKSCYGHTEGAAGLTGAVLLMHLNEKGLVWRVDFRASTSTPTSIKDFQLNTSCCGMSAGWVLTPRLSFLCYTVQYAQWPGVTSKAESELGLLVNQSPEKNLDGTLKCNDKRNSGKLPTGPR